MTFDPATLPLAFWYEAADASTLGPTEAGVGAITSKIGYIADKSGKGATLRQATDADRITLGTDEAGRKYFYGGGTKSLSMSTSAGGLTSLANRTKLTIFFAAKLDNLDADAKVPVWITPHSGQGSAEVVFYGDDSGTTQTLSTSVVRGSWVTVDTGAAMYHAEFDLTKEMPNERTSLSRNGEYPGNVSAPGVPVEVGSFGASATLHFFNRAAVDVIAFEGRIYAMFGFLGSMDDLSDVQLDGIAEYFNTKAGTPLNPSGNRLRFSHAHNWRAEQSGTGNKLAPVHSFATLYYDTAATSVDVEYCTENPAFASNSTIGVWIDGAYHGEIAPDSSGVDTSTYALPAGSKQVAIVSCAPYANNAPMGIGSFIRKVTFNAAATPVVKPATNRFLMYGDSVSQGGHTGPFMQYGLPLLVRASTTDEVCAYTENGRKFKDDYGNTTGGARQRLIDIVKGYAPEKMWFAMGRNDIYGGDSAATFGAQLEAFLDAAHTALPDLHIYVQSPLNPAGLTEPNSFGDTAQDFSDVMEAATVGRSWTTYVDGRTMIENPDIDLTDGTHQNLGANVRYAARIVERAGLTVSRPKAPQWVCRYPNPPSWGKAATPTNIWTQQTTEPPSWGRR